MKILWCMVPEIWSTTDRNLGHFGSFFALLPTNNSKNKNFDKMKKIPGGIVTLHKCTKNHDQMLYCFWDMTRDECNCYFLIWTIFCPFTPLSAQKIKIKKKWKTPGNIIYTCVPKIMSDDVRSEIWCAKVNEFA